MADKVKLHRKNLLKLAAGLLTLPDDTEKFRMADFDSGTSVARIRPESCGSSACAVGWAPTLTGEKPRTMEGWVSYSHRVLISESDSPEWEWCFSGDWYGRDDTPAGAAERIIYLLLHGVPESFTPCREGFEQSVEVYQDMRLV